MVVLWNVNFPIVLKSLWEKLKSDQQQLKSKIEKLSSMWNLFYCDIGDFESVPDTKTKQNYIRNLILENFWPKLSYEMTFELLKTRLLYHLMEHFCLLVLTFIQPQKGYLWWVVSNFQFLCKSDRRSPSNDSLNFKLRKTQKNSKRTTLF